MSVESATTSEISALFHQTSEALREHGTPAFGDNYKGEVHGLPVADNPNNYSMLLAGAALSQIREEVGPFTPDGLLLRGIQTVDVRFEEPHYTAQAVIAEEDAEYDYYPPKCSWQIDRGRGSIESVTVEPGWDNRLGPTYEVSRSILPSSKDARIGLTLTSKAEGDVDVADSNETKKDSVVSKRLVQSLFILANHFSTVAEQNDNVLLEALSQA